MTQAIFSRRGNRFDVKIEGHADYASGVPDIVCAACSTLACTLLECMEDLDGAWGVDGFRKEVNDDGLMHINVRASEWAVREVEVIMKTIRTGFLLLQDGYPDHVEVIETGDVG